MESPSVRIRRAGRFSPVGARVGRLLEQGAAVVARTLQDPWLLAEVGRKSWARLTAERNATRIGEYVRFTVPEDLGLASALHVPLRAVRSVVCAPSLEATIEELATYQPRGAARRLGGPTFLEAYYAVVRLCRPKVVLETGVAHGFGSAVVLQALVDNGEGHLYSVDLPTFLPGVVPHTGAAVPARLRECGRWELVLGPQARELPRLLRRLGAVDILLYDSDTSYHAMLHAWGLVWDYLRPGGLLVLSRIQHNNALMDFVEGRGLVPIVVPRPSRDGARRRPRVPGESYSYLGLVRRPTDGRGGAGRGDASEYSPGGFF